jgi:tRNA(Ile)-lysidine synthase
MLKEVKKRETFMMKSRFKDFINKNNLLDNCKSLLLGVSGGPDSLAMLNLFCNLSKELNIEIAAAHLDHNFRKESAAEADFVEKFVEKKGIKLFRKSENLPVIIKKKNISAEAAARKIRFDFFRNIIEKYNYDGLALAHHRDDQAETILLNLFRGTGLKGLSGIQAKVVIQKLNVIHPMLSFSKKEILNYCQKHKLEPCFDSSNEQSIYSRNIIRNEIFPIVENKINDKAREVISRNSKIIAAENEFLEKLTIQKYEEIFKEKNDDRIIIDFDKLKKINQVLQRRLYRFIYNKLNDNLDDLYFDHILEIEKLISNQQTGRGIDIASGIRVEISYSNLIFFKKNNRQTNTVFQPKEIEIEETIKINEIYSIYSNILRKKEFSFNENPRQAAFDFDKLKSPLKIRSRNPGDMLVPLGMSGHKKVKDILIDEKVPKNLRKNVPIITDADDNIIWLAPYRISDDYKITEKTNKVLILKLKYN